MQTSFLKKARCKRFMELGGCLQQELEPGQLWLDIAGESYSSSFEFDGFVLDMDKQEPTPRAGSSGGRQPAENKSDQRPARSDGGARSKSVKSDQCPARSDGTRSKASKSDGGQILKKEGKNLSYLYKDTSHLGVEGQVVSLGQARTRLGTLVMMFNFIGLGLALALVQEI